MLGLQRPRLKARPSLLQLICREPERPTSPPPVDRELPKAPLPDSPTSISSNPSTQATTMAPKDQEPHGLIFSISGPVVVAEHMIGCAMYELVSHRKLPPLPSESLLI